MAYLSVYMWHLKTNNQQFLCFSPQNSQFFSVSGGIPLCACLLLTEFYFIPTDVRIKRKPLLLLTYTVRGLTQKSQSESGSNYSSTTYFRVELKLCWKMEGEKFIMFHWLSKTLSLQEMQVYPGFATDVFLRHCANFEQRSSSSKSLRLWVLAVGHMFCCM